MKVAIIGGGGQLAEGVGSLLMQRGFDVGFYRPAWIDVPGVPRRPIRTSSRLSRVFVQRAAMAELDSFSFNYTWFDDPAAFSSAEVIIFALPSFLAERLGGRLASALSGRILLNLSDRFLGTYALAVAASDVAHFLPPRLGIAFNSPPLLAYQPLRDMETRVYFTKPFVMMSCFPQAGISEATAIVAHLFGFRAGEIRVAPSMLHLAFENINSILHSVQDLQNLRSREYGRPGYLYDPTAYTDRMVKRINAIAKERDVIARTLDNVSFRSLEEFDGSTFRNSVAQSGTICGTAIYRHEHPLLRSIPRPSVYTAHGYEDVGWSMVPMESLASSLRIRTPSLTELINEWNSYMNVDYRRVGRSVSSLRLRKSNPVDSDPRMWDWRYGLL